MRVLAIDIGGTKSALALCLLEGTTDPKIGHFETFKSSDFKSLEAMVDLWRSRHPSEVFDAIGAGVAGPIINGDVHLTNLGWTIQSSEVSRLTGKPFRICNDMASHAWGILSLSSMSLESLNLGKRRAGPKALIAAGTGLGESIISYNGNKYYPLSGEGGHATFAPSNEREFRLLTFLRRKQSGHISWERILGGYDGFRNLAEFLAEDRKTQLPAFIPSETKDWGGSIAKAAADGDSFATDLLQFYAELYGREAGNLALKCLPFAGLYIGGGIAPKILPWIKTHFMQGFLDKGRFAEVLRDIPVDVVLDPMTGLKGAALQFNS
jgi:glucokinase